MAYLKAAALAVVGAVVVGVGTALWSLLEAALRLLRPGDRTTVLSQAISEGMNCVAFYLFAFLPFALAVVFIARRWRRGRQPGP